MNRWTQRARSSYASNTKATVTQLRRDYNASLRDVRKLRSFSDQDRDAIRNAFCTAGEYEMHDRGNEVADPGLARSTPCTAHPWQNATGYRAMKRARLGRICSGKKAWLLHRHEALVSSP